MDISSPMLVRVFKSESELEVWKQDRTGRYALLKTYPICKWSGDLGPKVQEGDRQAPEGFYDITPGQMNPNSQFYLAFNIGYPNAYDRAHDRTGAHLMVHGDCSSRGCYAMSDEQIQEIFALGRESFFGGQKSFQVQAYPFRMTPANMAKHRNNPNMPFWRMLKEGNDHFEVTQQEPKVDVCEKRYVFNAAVPGGNFSPFTFSPKGRCPVYEVPQEIASAVNDKQRNDDLQIAQLAARGVPTAPIRSGRDGGMHPTFVAKLRPRGSRRRSGQRQARGRQEQSKPGHRLQQRRRTAGSRTDDGGRFCQRPAAAFGAADQGRLPSGGGTQFQRSAGELFPRRWQHFVRTNRATRCRRPSRQRRRPHPKAKASRRRFRA